jgi:type VI secretion system protein ImpK
MNDRNAPGPNRTVFQPSPLQQRRSGGPPGGAGQPPGPGQDAGHYAEQRFAPADDIPEAPEGIPPRNPMAALAAPLLALLAAMRSGRARLALPELHRRAAEEIEAFRREIAPIYSEEEVRRATYALAATADDIALNLPFNEADIAEWAQRSLVVRFFHEAIGGDRFWRLLEEMVARPTSYAHLLELYHACMAAGFEGRYRVAAGGSAQHAQIMQQVFQTLTHPPAQSKVEVSPAWRGVTVPAVTVGLWSRIAMVAGVAAGLLLVVYLVLHLISGAAGRDARAAVANLVEDEPLALSREARIAAPAPSALGDSIRRRLAQRIQANDVEVIDEPDAIRVRTLVPGLFASGSDRLVKDYEPLFREVADALNAEPGAVRVEGHTDSDRPRGATFVDNQQLSKARADVAADIIRGALTDKARPVTVEGFGDGRPLKSNKTPEGKSRNRRVEVTIQRGDR